MKNENKKPSNPNVFACAAGGDFLQEGIDLRDYFAAKAMQSFIGTNTDVDRTLRENKDTLLLSLTEAAYKVADAMLKQRELCK